MIMNHLTEKASSDLVHPLNGLIEDNRCIIISGLAYAQSKTSDGIRIAISAEHIDLEIPDNLQTTPVCTFHGCESGLPAGRKTLTVFLKDSLQEQF